MFLSCTLLVGVASVLLALSLLYSFVIRPRRQMIESKREQEAQAVQIRQLHERVAAAEGMLR